MQKLIIPFGCMLLLIVLLGSASHAAIVAMGASQDNTLYESATGALSNGAGEFLFAGRTSQGAGQSIRRGLVQFDISSMVPAGATINSATLTLELSRAIVAGAESISLHRVLSSWGEGTSVAPGQGGAGAAATPGDATWIHTSNPTTFWTSPGGDFQVTASDTQLLSANGPYNWSSASLAADVQHWVNSPSQNFGWLIMGNEATLGTSMQFLSRENAIGGPSLSIDFTAVPEPSCGLLSALAFYAFGSRNRGRIKTTTRTRPSRRTISPDKDWPVF